MAPPLAAASSSSSSSSSKDEEVDKQVEDEEVDKQVEEEQKGSAMKTLNSDPKTSHSSSDDDEEEEEDESEPATPIVSKPKKDALKPSPSDHSEPKTPSNDEDEEEEDDDETPPPKPKPIALKVSSNAKKHPLVSHKDSKAPKKKQKKVLLDGNEGEQKKEESEKKKNNNVIIQRIWSDEDEVVLLEGIIEDKKNGGIDPLLNLKEFLESIKKSLQFQEVKPEQLKNKIKRLRKKFENSSKRSKGDKDPVFSKPHEQLSYTLMKEIWGDDDDDDSVVVVNVKRKSSRIRKSQNVVGTKCHAIPTMMDSDDNNGDGNAVKKGDLEQKWRCLIVDELKLYLRRVELVREQTVAILDAHKSSDASEVYE